MLDDFLRDSPVYQEVLAEGLEKGLKKGLEAQRQTLLDICSRTLSRDCTACEEAG